MKKVLFILLAGLLLQGPWGCSKISSPVSPNSAAPAPVPAAPAFSAVYTAQWNAGSSPIGIGVNPSHQVVVMDADAAQVLVFDAQGNQAAVWGGYGTGHGQFKHPYGLTLDASGNVYVADAGNRRVQELDANGNFIRQVDSSALGGDSFTYPVGVGLDASGSLWISDINGVVWQINQDLSSKAWGKGGNLDGQFSYPIGAAQDKDGNLYVADYQGNQVVKINVAAGTATAFGKYGTEPGDLFNPTDVKVDGKGNILVVDSGNNRIQAFDANGKFLAQWGQTGDQTLNHPLAMALDGNSLYVTDNGNSRVMKYTLQ